MAGRDDRLPELAPRFQVFCVSLPPDMTVAGATGEIYLPNVAAFDLCLKAPAICRREPATYSSGTPSTISTVAAPRMSSDRGGMPGLSTHSATRGCFRIAVTLADFTAVAITIVSPVHQKAAGTITDQLRSPASSRPGAQGRRAAALLGSTGPRLPARGLPARGPVMDGAAGLSRSRSGRAVGLPSSARVSAARALLASTTSGIARSAVTVCVTTGLPRSLALGGSEADAGRQGTSASTRTAT
jgi:hypothetical protein